MDSYLMMLYVTLEQESAMKLFFIDQGWTFCKPDLSVTTDKIGPAIGDIPTDNQGNGSSSSLKNKRKFKSCPTNAPVIKQAKIVPGASATMSKKQIVSLKNADTQNDGISETSNAGTSQVNISTSMEEERENKILIKVESTDRDYEDYDDGNDGVNAGDDDDDTDVDYSYEEMEDREMGAEFDGSEASENKDNKTDIVPKAPTGNTDSLYSCPQCSRLYLSLRSLKQHQVTHSARRDFVCHVCSASFFIKATLNEHLATHDSSPSFICTACGELFARKSNLTRHSLIHKPRSEWPTCETCHKPCHSNAALLRHQACHGEKEQCGKCKNWFQYLSQHLRNCGSDEPYLPCKFCNKLLKNRKNLQEHVKYYHKKMRFQCTKCEKYFHNRSTCYRHEKICTT